VKRFVAFWMPSLLIKEQSPIKNPQLYWPPRDAIVSLASLASIAGLFLLWKRNRSACIIFLLWLVSFPPVYYLCAYQERHRIPVVWAILIPACYAVRELGMKFKRQEGTWSDLPMRMPSKTSVAVQLSCRRVRVPRIGLCFALSFQHEFKRRPPSFRFPPGRLH